MQGFIIKHIARKFIQSNTRPWYAARKSAKPVKMGLDIIKKHNFIRINEQKTSELSVIDLSQIIWIVLV